MTDIEKVALWFGLIASIVSIVLSIVAIVFAILVDRSARAVSAQTIKSLQKIESDVDRVSSDTAGLIKAGWDKMLGTVSAPSSDVPQASAKEIASGLLAEMRANLESTEHQETNPSPEHEEKLDDIFKRLESSLEAQLRTQGRSERPSEAIERIMSVFAKLSPEAKTIAYVLASEGWHVTFDQFKALSKESPIAEAIAELRDNGLLTPLGGLTMDGEKVKRIPVYYFPPALSKTLRAALLLLPEPPKELVHAVFSELQKVGYPKR